MSWSHIIHNTCLLFIVFSLLKKKCHNNEPHSKSQQIASFLNCWYLLQDTITLFSLPLSLVICYTKGFTALYTGIDLREFFYYLLSKAPSVQSQDNNSFPRGEFIIWNFPLLRQSTTCAKTFIYFLVRNFL